MSQSTANTTTNSGDQERYSRRLSDKIQAAFDHACDEGELHVAADLLNTLELVLLRVAPKPDRREAIVAPLMASHERLWHLRVRDQETASFDQPADPSTSDEAAPGKAVSDEAAPGKAAVGGEVGGAREADARPSKANADLSPGK